MLTDYIKKDLTNKQFENTIVVIVIVFPNRKALNQKQVYKGVSSSVLIPEVVAKEQMMNIEDIGERQIKTPARAIMVNRDDNVAVLLNEVQAGDEVMLGADWV